MAKHTKVIRLIRQKVLNQEYEDDPRGARYEIVGTALDGRLVAVICRIKETGKLLFITTWEAYE